jgi:hypothetical protein
MTAARSVVRCGPTLRVIRRPVDGAPRKFGTAHEPAVHPTTIEALRHFPRLRDRLAPVTATSALFVSGGGTRLLCCNVHNASYCLVCLTRAADLRSTRSTSHQLLGIHKWSQTPNRATPIDARPVVRRSSSSPDISTVAAMTPEVFPVVQRWTRPHRRRTSDDCGVWMRALMPQKVLASPVAGRWPSGHL